MEAIRTLIGSRADFSPEATVMYDFDRRRQGVETVTYYFDQIDQAAQAPAW